LGELNVWINNIEEEIIEQSSWCYHKDGALCLPWVGGFIKLHIGGLILPLK
jgi:hypothetical protein